MISISFDKFIALAIGVSVCFGGAGTSSQTIAIVGTGTASCAQIIEAVSVRPVEEREYFSGAQGYMSGILLSAPGGVDEGLSLTPAALPIRAQLSFVKAFCEQFPSASYSDSVETLYRALGGRAIK